MVKTIWQIDKAVDLFDFYYPSPLELDRTRIKVSRLEDVPYDGNIIVQGTVGQGKSIFLRHLTCVEAVDGTRLPLFVELRRIQAKERLEAHVINELKTLGLVADSDVFEFLCAEGYLALFLDAFDEVREDSRGELITEIESLARHFPKLRFVITSRPESGIEKSPSFRVFKLSPLIETEYEQVIERIHQERDTAAALIAGLRETGQDIQPLLTTPLMVALLVLRFRAEQSIPENHEAFFNNLFQLLLQRHDKTKAGYVRERKATIGDQALADVFEALSFLTRKTGATAYTTNKICKLTKKALQHYDLTDREESVLSDITSITCLLLEEGGEYRFIHKIVQEYHAACYIASQPDEGVQTFYTTMNGPKWRSWEVELGFLEMKDSYRWARWYMIPRLSNFLSGSDADAAHSVIRMLQFTTTPFTIGFNGDTWAVHRAVDLGFSVSGILNVVESWRLKYGLERYPAPKQDNEEPSPESMDAVYDGAVLLRDCGDDIMREVRKMVTLLRRDLERLKRQNLVTEQRSALMDV